MSLKIFEKLQIKINDWFIGFLIRNEEKIMEQELKKQTDSLKIKKKKEPIIEVPEKVIYPQIEFLNAGIYYKQIKHPFRNNVIIYVSSFDLFPLTVLLTSSAYDPPKLITQKMNDLIMLIIKIDVYNNLKPVKYWWIKNDDLIELGYDDVSPLKKEKK